MGIFYYKHME